MKKTAIALALAAMTTQASAAIVDMDFEGAFTMITPNGGVLTNPDAAGGTGTWDDAFGVRTTIGGSMTFDTTAGTGSASIGAFDFSGTNAEAHDVTFTAIGDGMGNPGTLVLASMLFDYGPTLDIPVYAVADAAGFFGAAMGGLTVGQTLTGAGGATSTADAAVNASAFGALVGDVCASGCVMSMTSWDVNQDANGDLVGGGFPLADDGISGVKMATAPFPGHGANFDISSATITAIDPGTSPVPVPAAVWLFGSGLLGLVGVARRRKNA